MAIVLPLCDPVIVMGMAQCGTTLLAEMIHRAGTPMYSGAADPSYDLGLKYERPLCKAINRLVLGVPRDATGPHSTEPMWTWPLRPFPCDEMDALRAEVGTGGGAWGFKDPRTTLTYNAWLEAFPAGARLYTYRRHTEYLRRSLRAQQKYSPRRARQQMRAWLAYNEALIRNCASDKAAGRRWALLCYDELMEDTRLIRRAEAVTGVPLFDARDPALCRTHAAIGALPLRERLYVLWGEAGQSARLRRVYALLEALRLHPAP